jgi:hypothetical protein
MIASQTVSPTASPELELLNPIPRPSSGPFAVKVRPEKAEIYFVDNNKPNSLVILKRAQAELRRRGVAVREAIGSKPFAGGPMTEEQLAELSQEKGLVLCGVNDCGSCSMGGALDSVLLQRAGVAGFTILTTPFGDRVRDITAFQETDRPLPAIVLSHPMQNISDAELDQRAVELADAAQRMLNGEEPR